MIEESLRFIRDEMANYIVNDLGHAGTDVDMGNIALFETEDATSVENRLVITLVNIEEESTLKNSKNFRRGLNGGVRYKAPPVHLNLYILFSCNFSMYNTSLQHLGNVIRFFQQRSWFNIKTATGAAGGGIFSAADADFRLNFELYTLTFEQINHLWGALGGRQLPSVMYKARLVQIDDERISREGPPIEEIQSEVNSINDC